MYNLYITMNEKLDYAQICDWLRNAADFTMRDGSEDNFAPEEDFEEDFEENPPPKETFLPVSGCWPDDVRKLFAEHGLATASGGERCALAAVEGDRTAEDLLDEFRQSPARRMYLFASRCLTRQSFIGAILDVDANLLDKSILLPMEMGDRSARRRMSLLVLDKERKGEQRVPVTFIVASRVGGDNLFDAPRAEKNFWEIAMRKEPIIASRHVPPPVMESADSLERRPLSEIADVIRTPAYYKRRLSDKRVLVQCLSPKSFARYGYTWPNGLEVLYDESALRDEMFLRPSDILVIGLRSVGKAAIIHPSFSEPNFLGTNSTYIVRCRPGTDPRALFMYITSNSARLHLINVAASSGTPVLRIGDLKGLPVPVVDDGTRAGMIAAFEELEAIEHEVWRLESKARKLQGKYFPIKQPKEFPFADATNAETFAEEEQKTQR